MSEPYFMDMDPYFVILYHLISNAVQYSEKDTEIQVEVMTIDLEKPRDP